MLVHMIAVYVLVVVLYIILGFVIWMAWPMIVGAPWVPTPRKKVRNMLELAQVKQGDLVYDLGSGDGRIIIMAAQEFGAQSIGVEVDLLRVLWSRFAIRRSGLSRRVKVIRGNFFNIDFSDATVITAYQGVGVNKKLEEKLSQELKPGTRVVSHNFTFQEWKLVKTNEESGNYLYIV